MVLNTEERGVGSSIGPGCPVLLESCMGMASKRMLSSFPFEIPYSRTTTGTLFFVHAPTFHLAACVTKTMCPHPTPLSLRVHQLFVNAIVMKGPLEVAQVNPRVCAFKYKRNPNNERRSICEDCSRRSPPI